MSLKLQSLAFLKEKKFKYYINNNVIYFSCLDCNQKAEMNAHTTSWSCKCGSVGNLGTLIKQVNEKSNIKTTIEFINPKKEKYEINFLLNKLSDPNRFDIKDVKVLQEKFNKICSEFGL